MRITLVITLSFWSLAPLRGQVTGGQISGTVRDSSGAVVLGVAVHVIDDATGLDRTAQTNKDGFYAVTSLPVGAYRVRVEHPGFKVFVRTGIQLTVGERIDVSPALEVGNVSETVSVMAQGEAVETESGTVGALVDGSQIRGLSLNGRNLMQLLMLLPGVTVGTDIFDSGAMLYGDGSNFFVNGTRSTSNAMTVDGGTNQDSGNVTTVTNNVSVDFVQEVKVQSSGYGAEFGRNAGGQINFVTRKGTEQYHGTLLEFFRNDKLNARSFFAPRIEQLRMNNFGWNVGGPAPLRGTLRKKLFFFAGEEFKRRIDGQTNRATIPDADELAGIIPTTATLRYPSNFRIASLAGQPIADPSRATPSNSTGKNILPLQYATPNGLAMMKIYSSMVKLSTFYSDTATSNNITFQVPVGDFRREDIARVDYQPSAKNQFTLRMIYDTGSDINPYETGTLPTFWANRRNKASNLQASWTRVQSGGTVNELAVLSNYLYLERLPVNDLRLPSTYGLNIHELWGNEMNVYGIPAIAISGFTTISGARANPRSPVWEFNMRDNFSQLHGKHLLKTGFVLFRVRKNERTNATLTGSATFNPSGALYSTGNSILDALLGNYNTYVESDVDKQNRSRWTQFEGYLADTWKARPNLTIDIGMRYYMMQPPKLTDDAGSAFIPGLFDPSKAQQVVPTGTAAGQLAAGVGKPLNGIAILGRDGQAETFYPTQIEVSPRFGFAYDPTRRGSFSIRGGFAVFYDRLPAGDIAYAGGNPPFVNTYTLYNGSIDNLASGSAAQFPVAITSYRMNGVVAPATYNWNFGVEKKLPFGSLLSVNYVSTQGRHLLRQLNLNLVTPMAQLKNTSANQNALRPYQGYTNVLLWESSACSNYRGLQVGLTRRYASNLTYSIAYTFSKALTDASDKTGGVPQDVTNLRAEKSHATFDRNHVMVSSLIYHLPFFKSRHGLVGLVGSGWDLSVIAQFQSGQWVTATFDSATGSRRPNAVGPVQYLDPRQVQTLTAGTNRPSPGNYYFNPTPGVSFVNPAAGQYGNASPNNVRGPGRNNWDLSLFKVFRVTERTRLQFRAEAFNALNHASFRNPNMDSSALAYATISNAGPPRVMQLGLKLLV